MAIFHDLRLRLASAEIFLDALFPVRDVDGIFDEMCDSNNYDFQSRRWASLPEAPTDVEGVDYQPFTTLVSRIQSTALRTLSSSAISEDSPVTGVWLDRNTVTPRSSHPYTPATRPEIIFSVSSNDIEKLDEQIDAMTTGNDADRLDEDKWFEDKLKEKLKVWWRQIHVPVEVKRKWTAKEERSAVVQLCGYLKQMLGEQLDRRFAFGITLCFDRLNVWLCDRSGIVAVKDAINIHERPKEFIQIIAGLATLPASRLGWDPSMKMYMRNRGEPRFSYDIPWNSPGMPEINLGSIHWVIDTRSEDKPERMVTIRPLSVTRAENMCGRATLVWEVVKWADRFDPKQVYILKRYWRPYQCTPDPNALCLSMESEGDLFNLLPSCSKRIYSYRDVEIGRERDSTLESIRKGVFSDSQHQPESHNLQYLDEEAVGTDNIMRASQIPRELPVEAPDDDQGLQSRVHAELVMLGTGFTVDHFKDLLELVTVLGNCVEDYEEYYDKGIVQRDVSIGNIIISICLEGLEGAVNPRTGPQAKGRLIDLDHAKRSKIMVNVFEHDITEEASHVVAAVQVMLRFEGIHADNDVLQTAGRVVGFNENMIGYIRFIARIRGLVSSYEEPLGFQQLQWIYPKKERPTFRDHNHRKGERTGTYDFMSYEAVNADFHLSCMVVPQGKYIWEADDPEKTKSDGIFFQDAIHDMESLVWVAIKICLTRKGPGANMQRDELLPGHAEYNTPRAKALRIIIHALFDTNAAKKGVLVAQPMIMATYVLPHFHPYFDALKPMITQLWETLAIGYCYRGLEYYHILKYMLATFKETMGHLSAVLSGPIPKATQREVERRLRYIDTIRNTFRDPDASLGDTKGSKIPV